MSDYQKASNDYRACNAVIPSQLKAPQYHTRGRSITSYALLRTRKA